MGVWEFRRMIDRDGALQRHAERRQLSEVKPPPKSYGGDVDEGACLLDTPAVLLSGCLGGMDF